MPLFGKRKRGGNHDHHTPPLHPDIRRPGRRIGVWASAPPRQSPLPFRYAFSAISWETDIESAVKTGEKLGFPGIEPFRHNIVNYLGRPLALKKFMDDHQIRMATCSNGGGPDFSSGNFFDPAQADKTVADHIKFVREFIVPFGYCKHFKMNMGPRPKNYDTTDEMVKRCADSLNKIGREILKDGIKLALHRIPTHWCRTSTSRPADEGNRSGACLDDRRPGAPDPGRWSCADGTADHLLAAHRRSALQGCAPQAARRPRWWRCQRGTGPEAGGHNWFRAMTDPDAGGVDFPRVQKFLIDKQYNGWVTLDYDASMMEHSKKSMEQLLAADKKYIVDVLKVDPAKENLRCGPGGWRPARRRPHHLVPGTAAAGAKALAAQFRPPRPASR